MATFERLEIALRQHQVTRLNAVTTAGEGLYPSNWEGTTGTYHTVHVANNEIVYRRSDSGGPPFAIERDIASGTFFAPRVIEDVRRRVWVLYGEETGEEVFDVKHLFSDDQGESWSNPAVAISGGKWPVVATGFDGTLLFAAWVGGAVQGYTRHPLDESAQTPVTWQEWNGSSLVDLDLEDTTFGVQQEFGRAARWWLHGQRTGASDTTNWWSADGVTWQEEV